MPYYHVKIRRKKGRPSVLYLFDLSKDRLMLFLRSACHGQEFPVDQKGEFVWIVPRYINEIRIVETNKDSSSYGIGYMKGEEIFKKGKDVTENFVAKPIERGKKSLLKKKSKRIFIVHGKDRKSLNELKGILKGLKLTPIVLHEQPGGSRTIVEKLEKYSDVGYAFVILTPDDTGISRTDNTYLTLTENLEKFPPPAYGRIDYRPMIAKLREILLLRARQNVILEFGYFMGLLGRDKVCCLYKGDIELPSDMHGIVYIHFKESIIEVRDKIVKELKAAGYRIGVKKQREEEKAREKLEKIEKEAKKVLNALEQMGPTKRNAEKL